jgi:uncharacterized protein (DUF1499 family)
MSDSQKPKRPSGTRWCGTGVVFSGSGAVLILLGLTGARIELLSAMAAFMVFGIGLLALLIGVISTVIGLIMSKGTGGATSAVRAWSALTIAVVFIAVSMSQRPTTSGGSPIHDITTDVGNPPSFDALVPIREASGARNPPEYAGGKVAEIQKSLFPNIETLTVEKPADEVFAAAENVARELGWEIVRSDPQTGQIEATATTYWFRFKDDVAIRLIARGQETYVDVRSKSRIGSGDMGANAARVQAFLRSLKTATDD